MDNAPFWIVAVALVVLIEAGVLYVYVRLRFSPLSMWVGWFAMFLLIANNQDVSACYRIFISSSSASAIYQLSTSPCFRRKDFRKKDEGEKAQGDPDDDEKA